MIKKVSWIESPAFNWAGVAVSLVMLVLYVQQLMSPGHSSSTPYVTAAWAVIFVVWLATAVHKSWFNKS
jgi:hypothetical protein